MLYPPLTPGFSTPLRVVLIQLRDDPSYLDDPSCPYSDDVKDFFREFASPGAGGEAPSLKELKDLEKQIEHLIHGLDQMAATLTSRDHAEKLAFFKTKASLLDKIVSLKERIINLKEMGEFQAV